MSRLTSKLTREEATNALYYKQGQEQGYKRGVADVLDKVKTELDKMKAEIKETYNGCYICDWWEDYDWDENDISEYVSVGSIEDVLEIIDKYRNLCYNGGEVKEEEEEE